MTSDLKMSESDSGARESESQNAADSDPIAVLRKRALIKLRDEFSGREDLSMDDAESLIHELQTHKIELELQNEELRRAQEELARSHQRYFDLYELAQYGFVTVDLKGMIQEANLTLAKMLGIERQLIINQPLSAFVHTDDQDTFYRYRRNLIDSKHRQSCQLRLLKRDAEPLWVELESVFAEADEENCDRWESVVSDISERRRYEQERNVLISDLREKNSELEKFTYTVSHDLKSPLITVTGFISMLKSDIAKNDTEKVQNDINRINEAISKMHALLQDLLKLSRAGELKGVMETFSMESALSDVLEIMAGQVAARNAVIRIASKLEPSYGNLAGIEVVLQNLIDNAIKYCPENLTPEIEIGCERQEGHIRYYVKDNGQGIAREHHGKVFELFEQLDSMVDGSGVGLAIVRRIIERNSGRIWVESEGEGAGCTFFFTLPCEDTANE